MRRVGPEFGTAICTLAVVIAGCSGTSSGSTAIASSSTAPDVVATATPPGLDGRGSPSPLPGSWTPMPSPGISALPQASAAPAATPSARPLPAISAGHLRGANASRGYRYDVAYPALAGNRASTGQVDASIRSHALDMVKGFLSDIGGIEVVEPAGPSELTATYSIALLTPELVSVRLLVSQYVSGAAHPLDGVVTLSYELSSGRELRLGDGFASTQRLLAILSSTARRDLKASLGGDYLPDVAGPGTRPAVENFASWALTGEGIEITFGEYQVGPYALGMPVVNVPWASLRSLVDPAGPLAGLAGG